MQRDEMQKRRRDVMVACPFILRAHLLLGVVAFCDMTALLLDSYLNIVFNDIIICDMHEHFVSSIYCQNLTRNTMGTNKPGWR